jgi:hypothetical protein
MGTKPTVTEPSVRPGASAWQVVTVGAGPRPAGGRTYPTSSTCSGAGGCPGRTPGVGAGAGAQRIAHGKRSGPLCVVLRVMNTVAFTVPCANAVVGRIKALVAHLVQVCERCAEAFWSTVLGHRGVSMSSEVLQWSLARPETPPAGPVIANSSAPSLVVVDAPAPATGPRVATASRRKVVGVDCV